MKVILRVLLHVTVFLLLTILTQIGGVVYGVSLLTKQAIQRPLLQRLVFPALYLIVWWLLPFIATPLGRVPLPVWATPEAPLQAQHWFLVLANRHYVKPVLRAEVVSIAKAFAQQNSGTSLTYLDANFPFWNGFPLLPHRSHDDGEKLDLAFVYRVNNQITTQAPAFFGYGRVAAPRARETNQPARCEQQGYWQYSLLKYAAIPFNHERYQIDEMASAKLVRLCAKRKNLRKLFLEPHLKQRWKLSGWNKIRFHGCAAVRHDDHLHVQL